MDPRIHYKLSLGGTKFRAQDPEKPYTTSPRNIGWQEITLGTKEEIISAARAVMRNDQREAIYANEDLVTLVLDDLKFTLDLIGLIPFFGAPFDLVSAGVSAVRSDPVAGSISLLAIVWDAGGVAKVARRADAGTDALKLSQKADDNAIGHT